MAESLKVDEIGKVCATRPLSGISKANSVPGFSPDPVLTGVAMRETIEGIQDSGVVACAKHYIGNEQEHFRQAVSGLTKYAYSANIDDVTMHELYLW